MRRSKRRKKVRNLGVLNFIGSVAAGIIIIMLCLIGFSAIISRFGASGGSVSALANVALCIGSFFAGFTAAKRNHKNGIGTGIICGLLIYVALYIVGTVILRRFIGLSLLTKLILVAICSTVGGIFGVNTKIRRPPL